MAFKAGALVNLPGGHDLSINYHSDVVSPVSCHCNGSHVFCAHVGSPIFEGLAVALAEPAEES